MGELARSGDVPIVPPSYSRCPRPSAAPPPIGGRFITTNPARSRCSTRRRVLWITEIASFFASQAQLLAKPKTLNRRNSPKSAAILIASGQNPTLGTHAGRSQKGGLLPSKGRPGRVGLRPER